MTLKDEISAVMERSACARFETSDKVISARHDLKSFFPQLHFDFTSNTFSDPAECGPPREISDLASTRRRYIKQFASPEDKAITSLVSRVYNAAKEIKRRKVEAVEEIHARMLEALEKRKVSPFCKLVGTVEGKYRVPGRGIEFVVSGHPVDVLQKATGTPWETISCEKYGGPSFDGVYSDTEQCNMTCVVQDISTGYKFARIMLRWCITEKGDVGIGIEEEWYFANADNLGTAFNDDYDKEIAPNLKAYQATAFLRDLLEKLGYMVYDVCVTPYAYQGYSDTAGHGVQITFKKKRACK